MASLAILFALQLAPEPPVALERVGTLKHEPIAEASGLVRSRKFPGVYWVHNDSGNPAVLFAVRRDGSLIREYAVNVPNVDWEDVATDNDGHLYVGDIGNNGGRLPVRAVYQFDEPDPFKGGEKALRVKGSWHYRFPPEGRFDAESLVTDGARAWIVSKTFEGEDADVYSLDLTKPATLLRPALPEKAGTLPGFKKPATGAGLSADGRRLVVCALDQFGVYEKGGDGNWKAITVRAFDADDQIEAVAWDGDDILLAGEERGIFRVKEAVWKGGKGQREQAPPALRKR